MKIPLIFESEALTVGFSIKALGGVEGDRQRRKSNNFVGLEDSLGRSEDSPYFFFFYINLGVIGGIQGAAVRYSKDAADAIVTGMASSGKVQCLAALEGAEFQSQLLACSPKEP